MKIYVLTRSGGANAREYEESFTVIGVYWTREAGSEQFHALVDEAIKDAGFSEKGVPDPNGGWSYKGPNEDDIHTWELGETLHCIDEYQCQYMRLDLEEIQA